MGKFRYFFYLCLLFGFICFGGMWISILSSYYYNSGTYILLGGRHSNTNFQRSQVYSDVTPEVLLGFLATFVGIIYFYKRVGNRQMPKTNFEILKRELEEKILLNINKEMAKSLRTNRIILYNSLQESNKNLSSISDNYNKLEKWMSLNDLNHLNIIESINKRLEDLENNLNKIKFEIQLNNSIIHSIPSSLVSRSNSENSLLNVETVQSCMINRSIEVLSKIKEKCKLGLNYSNSDTAIYIKPKDIRVLDELDEIESEIEKARSKTKLNVREISCKGRHLSLPKD